MSDPLINFAPGIAAATGRGVPTPNPGGPTTRAVALFVLRDPGATATSGANATGVLDPYFNSDPTSLAQRKALSAARIDPGMCVWWNASPYHLGYRTAIRDEDAESGARYLRQIVRICPDLRVVVAMGRDAKTVAALAWRSEEKLPPLIPSPHPLIYGIGWEERKAKLGEALRKAARLIRG